MKQKIRPIWLFFVLVSSLPFFMRLGMDGRAAQRQAVLELYRDWRWSTAMRELPKGTELIFLEGPEKDTLRELFKTQLQQDFKLNEMPSTLKIPTLKTYFEEGTFIRARFELLRNDLPSAPRQIWMGESRLTNNGILLGTWVLLMALLFGKSLEMSLGMGLFILLFWTSHWSLFQIPVSLLETSRGFINELYLRFQQKDWSASEYGRLPQLGVLIWWVLSFILSSYFLRKKRLESSLKTLFILSIFMEPVALWTSSLLAHWSPDTSWWKLYLGSLCFRFLSLGSALFAWMYPAYFSWTETKVEASTLPNNLSERRFTYLSLCVPVFLVFSGLWAWSNAVLSPGPSLVILRLKIFVVSFLMGFVLGSRLFSLWLGTLSLAILLPPMTGHWNASAFYGFLFDGLLLGWIVSPLKGISPVLLLNFNFKVLGSLFFMAWFLGVFLSSVGVPVLVSWVALFLSLWALGQVIEGPSPSKGLL